MVQSPVIDVEALLAPISEDSPTGEELPLSEPSGPLMTTKDAWDEARSLVKRKQDWEQSGGIDAFGEPLDRVADPDWNSVIQAATGALAISKDFRVAAWLLEGLLREHHLVGLCNGLELCLGLCERYWPQIHPAANEEDGHGITVGVFSGVVSEGTAQAILDTPVVRGQIISEREPREYTAADLLRAREMRTLTDADEVERRVEKLGYVQMADFEAVQGVTPPEFHVENLAIIDQCQSLLNRLGEFLLENCSDDEYGERTSPGVGSYREKLDELRRIIVELSGGESEVAEEQDNGAAEAAAIPRGGNQEWTRDSAFQTIERVAQFFEKTEPHSPVHYALRQVVRWGKMPLPDLLAELVEDGSVMEALRKRVGFPVKQEEDGY